MNTLTSRNLINMCVYLKCAVFIFILIENADAEETVISDMSFVRSSANGNTSSLVYMQRFSDAGIKEAMKNTFDDGLTAKKQSAARILPNRQICGPLTEEDRIFGGENAAIDEFPWLARIKYILNNGKEVYACAGSLITDNYILTAAHCAVNLTIKEVRLGDWNIETEPDCQGSVCSGPSVDIKVVQVSVYPHYRESDTFKGDVALLRLQRPVNFTDFIRPICLPTTKNIAIGDYSSNGVFWTAGWGKTENEKKSQIKQKVELISVPIDDCRKRQPIISDDTAPFAICAGGVEGKDTCVGDSGGSLVKLMSENKSTNWFLVGVTSYGHKHCGSAGRPGLYARITPLMEWILSIVDV